MRILTPYWPQQRATGNFFDDMDRVFADFANIATAAPAARAFRPPAEVSEHKEHYLMSFDLPGIQKEDIKIEMKENVLTIAGERKSGGDKEGTPKAQIFERQYGTFQRSFTLPTTVSEEKIEAHYENGVLSLYLPKTPVAQAKTIEINSEKNGFFSQQLTQ
ncbi:Spore protein SP21 [compost metagenome]